MTCFSGFPERFECRQYHGQCHHAIDNEYHVTMPVIEHEREIPMDKAVHPESDKQHRQDGKKYRLCRRQPPAVIILM